MFAGSADHVLFGDLETKLQQFSGRLRQSLGLMVCPPKFNRQILLPNYLSQRLIDPVLPARSRFLKVIKNVPINSQRDKLLGIRDSRRLRREFHRLRGCRLEGRLSRIP
jgi:hypothetical protein